LKPITLYTLGEGWWDLCAGPHVANTGELNGKAFDLESVAGAYWRGDENNAPVAADLRHGLGKHLSNWPNTGAVSRRPCAGITVVSASIWISFRSKMRPGLVWCSGIPVAPASAC